MHDTDRTQREYQEYETPEAYETPEYQETSEAAEVQEVQEVMEALEAEAYEHPEAEYQEGEYHEYEGETTEAGAEVLEMPLSEAEEMELASELLEVTNEAEFEQFLGRLFKRIGRGIRKIARPLGGFLRGVARRALPVLGKAAGTFFGGPIGGAVGGRLASGLGRAFGLELEGLSPEDREFEVARRFVRFAADAGRRAGAMASRMPARVALGRGIATAARRHAPGMVPWLRGSCRGRRGPCFGRARTGTAGSPGSYDLAPGASGRWIRRGDRIILFGA